MRPPIRLDNHLKAEPLAHLGQKYPITMRKRRSSEDCSNGTIPTKSRRPGCYFLGFRTHAAWQDSPPPRNGNIERERAGATTAVK